MYIHHLRSLNIQTCIMFIRYFLQQKYRMYFRDDRVCYKYFNILQWNIILIFGCRKEKKKKKKSFSETIDNQRIYNIMCAVRVTFWVNVVRNIRCAHLQNNRLLCFTSIHAQKSYSMSILYNTIVYVRMATYLIIWRNNVINLYTFIYSTKYYNVVISYKIYYILLFYYITRICNYYS